MLTVDEKWFTARIKHPQVRLIPVADGFSSTVSTIVGQKKRSEGYLLVLLVRGFLVLRESRRSLSVEPVQVVTLCAKVTCTGINGVEIMTRVPRRHGDRHGESKGTSTKISDLKKMVLYYESSAPPPILLGKF